MCLICMTSTSLPCTQLLSGQVGKYSSVCWTSTRSSCDHILIHPLYSLPNWPTSLIDWSNLSVPPLLPELYHQLCQWRLFFQVAFWFNVTLYHQSATLHLGQSYCLMCLCNRISDEHISLAKLPWGSFSNPVSTLRQSVSNTILMHSKISWSHRWICGPLLH